MSNGTSITYKLTEIFSGMGPVCKIEDAEQEIKTTQKSDVSEDGVLISKDVLGHLELTIYKV